MELLADHLTPRVRMDAKPQRIQRIRKSNKELMCNRRPSKWERGAGDVAYAACTIFSGFWVLHVVMSQIRPLILYHALEAESGCSRVRQAGTSVLLRVACRTG